MAPDSFERTSAPATLGLEETRASVASRSVLFNDGRGGDEDTILGTLSGFVMSL